jgi:hypothetical protein
MLPPTVAAALIASHESDRARIAEHKRRGRRARPDESDPTRRRGVWTRAARTARVATQAT